MSVFDTIFNQLSTSDLVKSIFMGQVRHLAAVTGPALIALGILPANQLTEYSSAIVLFGIMAWSAWQKYKSTGKI